MRAITYCSCLRDNQLDRSSPLSHASRFARHSRFANHEILLKPLLPGASLLLYIAFPAVDLPLIQMESRFVTGNMNALHEFTEQTFQSAQLLPRGLLVTSTADQELPLSSEDQIALVGAIARDGDRLAFERLFRHFGPRLKTFLMRRGLNALTAEEIVQETMLSVWRKASYFDAGRAGVATWIFSIARNLSIDNLRRDRSGVALDEDPSEAPEPMQSGEDIVMASERDERVRMAMTKLSPDQLAVVRLSFFSEKPHVEIAEELGIPLGTVKSRVRLAMQRLRSLLEDLI